MEESRKFIKHISHYFTGSVLTTVAGFISFPVFTRIFSVSEYGIMNLISSLFLFTVALGKFGIQNAAVRFYGEFNAGKKGNSISEYYATLFWSTIVTAAAATFLLWLGVRFMPLTSDNQIFIEIVSFACIIVFLSCVTGILFNFLRAEQQTVMYNLLGTAGKYLSLGLNIFLVLYLIRGITGFYIGSIVADACILTFLIMYMRRTRNFSLKFYSWAFLKEAVSYGFPLIWFEFANIILAFGDRVMIEIMMDSKALGIYSAGYNISMFIWPLFIDPLGMSITPLYMNMWAVKGIEETRLFLKKSLAQFLAVAIPAGFGLSYLSKEVIVFFASSKYAESYAIVPYVVAGLIIYGTYSIVGAGIHIYKRTYLLTFSVIAACILNIILNFLLIPRIGIVGAALATMIAYIVLVAIIGWNAFKLLPFEINYRAIGRYILLSLFMILVISRVSFDNHVINLFARISCGMLVYGSLLLMFDRDIKDIVVHQIVPKLKRMFGG